MTGIRKSYQAHLKIGTGFMALAAVPGVAVAQEAAPITQAAPAEEEAGGIHDIVVTARKRAERTQDIPVSIRAVDAEMIARQDITGLEKLSAKAPELVIARSSNGSGASLTIRGVGSNFTSVGVEQSVAVIVDGAYYGHGRVIDEGFFDLDRIEVLKGPQALFFGKNATAGVISITTADPGDHFEGRVRAGYEFTAEQIYGEVVGSGPLSDTLGIRVALRGSKAFGGYTINRAVDGVYNVFDAGAGFAPLQLASRASRREQPRLEELIGRVTLKWAPVDGLTDTLKISGTRDRGGAPGYATILRCSGPNAQSNSGGNAVGNPSPLACGTRKFTTYYNDLPDVAAGSEGIKDTALYGDYDSFAVNNNLNWDLNDDIALTSVTNFNRNKIAYLQDYAGSNAPQTWAALNSKLRAFSNETRILTSFDGSVNLLFGTYYQKSKRTHQEDVAFFGLIDTSKTQDIRYLALTKVSTTKGETASAFGQVIWKIVPTVELTGGVRYTHETKDSFFKQPYVNVGAQGFFLQFNPANAANTSVTKNQTFNNWSPEATLTWKPSSDVTVYAAYKTGYKSGGFSNSGLLSPADPTGSVLSFNPEKAKGFEGGVKTTLFDRQLRFNVGVYRYTFSGLQIDYFDSTNVYYITRNAGSSRTTGIETDFEYAPRAVEGLTLRGTLNYNRSKYVNFLAPCYTGQSFQQGCNLPNSSQQLDGIPTANAPRWTAASGFEYDIPVSSEMSFGIGADVRYSDKYNASAFNAPTGRQKSYATIDGSLRLKGTESGWELALIGKNLTNRQYFTGVYDAVGTGSGTGAMNGSVLSDAFALAAPPRTIQLQGTFRF